MRKALEEAVRRTRRVHAAQLPAERPVQVTDGLTVTGRYVPAGRAGVYVPGGLVAYPSSVVMNIVPAQVAGVASIAVASPPQRDNGGLPHPSVLAACALLGVREVHAAGGAQALAMFAYGTRGLRARRRHHRAGQRLRGRGQAGAARRGRHRRRERPHRGGGHRRRHRGPPPRRRRPGRPGRARRTRRLPAHHHRRRPGRPRGRGARRGRSPRPGTASASRKPSTASPPACSSTTRTRRSR